MPEATQDTMLAADFFDPLVWGGIAQAEFEGRAIIANSTAVLRSNTLEGVPGSTVRFPRWTAMSEIEDILETESVPLDTLTQEESEAVIKEAAKGFAYTDTADLTGLGDIQSEGLRQFGDLAARKVDSDLIKVAVETVKNGHRDVKGNAKRDSKPFAHTLASGVTWPGIVDALEVFGDDFEPSDYAGIFLRAEHRSQIMKDPTFIRASEVSATPGEGSVVKRGWIGQIAGLDVFITNRLPAKTGLIMKRGALGILYKRLPLIEQDRDILARKNFVTLNMHYATKRLNDKGVLALTIEDAPVGE